MRVMRVMSVMRVIKVIRDIRVIRVIRVMSGMSVMRLRVMWVVVVAVVVVVVVLVPSAAKDEKVESKGGLGSRTNTPGFFICPIVIKKKITTHHCAIFVVRYRPLLCWQSFPPSPKSQSGKRFNGGQIRIWKARDGK